MPFSRGPSGTFCNPIAEGADPWVYRHTDGFYYMTLTTGHNVTLWRSRCLSGIGGGEKKILWTPPLFGPNSKNLWAPELHFLRGKWYVYFAADDGRNENHRMYVLENDHADPFQGQFVERGRIADPGADTFAIDGTVFQAGDRLYFVWSGWEGCVNERQNLYIAPMSDPWAIRGPRVEISRPTYAWETVGRPHVNEGPQVLCYGGAVHLVYSASGSWTDEYCLGLLTAPRDADLLIPTSWRKHALPVLCSGNGVFAPGHASFVKSPDGCEDWIVYHAARSQGAGWDRNIRAQRFTWDDSGKPCFGCPVPPGVPMKRPGGELPETYRRAA